MSNEITAYFKGTAGVSESVYQFDYGMILIIDGLDLTAPFEVHFEHTGGVDAVTAIGQDNRVAIPNACLALPGRVTAYIYDHTGQHDGQTAYVVRFQVMNRARPVDDVTDEQDSAISKAIALLAEPIDNIETIVNEALAKTGTTLHQLEEQFNAAVHAVTTDTEVTDIRVGDDGVTYSTAGQAVREQFSNLKDNLSDVADSLGSDMSVTFTYTEDHFISSAGYIADSSEYAYSEPISVKQGDHIIFDASGYQTNVAMISQYTEGFSYHPPLVISAPSVLHYEYTAPVDMQLVFSFRTTLPHNLSIIRDIKEDIAEIASNTGDLDELTSFVAEEVYTNIESIGTLYPNKNAQLTADLTRVSLSNGNDNYKAIVIDDLTGVEYVSAYCTAGSDKRYASGIICATSDNIVVKTFNLSGTQNTTISFKVPTGTEKIYINGVYITPTAHSASRTLVSAVPSNEIVDEMLDYQSLTYVNGYYIMRNGRKSANNDFKYSESFYLKPCHLLIKARGYLTNVAILSKGKTTDATVTPLIYSADNKYRIYSIDITEEGYYLVCTNASTDAEVIAMPLIYSSPTSNDNPYCDLSIFRKFGVVGDSYASGEIYYGNTYHDKYFNSWGQVMARKHGTVCTNYSSGGLTTRSWLTATKGLPLLLSSDAEDIYYLALGINDYYHEGQAYLGDITDITSHQSYEDYGDTFYGNYGRIIEQIQAHAPHAKIVMFTVANTNTVPQMFSDAIIEIAEHYNIPYIVQAEDSFFQSSVYTNMAGGHPTSIGYSGMAVAFERLLNRCIVENMSYFFDLYMYD